MGALALQSSLSRQALDSSADVSALGDPLDRFRCRVSLRRVLLMTFLSYGLYLFYWAYLTWKRHRQHTGGPGSPVWRALSLAVPVYGWFRLASHVRTYRDLAAQDGAEWTVAPGAAAGALIVVTALAWAPLAVRVGGVTQTDAVTMAAMGVAQVAVTAILLRSVQRDMNAYWSRTLGVRLLDTQIRAGEVMLAMAGIALWADTVLTFISGPYRAGM